MPSAAQVPHAAATNPLDELQRLVQRVLTDAGVPFTEEQSKAIALMREDRRQASEDLFGRTMDFRDGPVQGDQLDRAMAAIAWMETEFTKRITEYLTAEQRAAWESHLASRQPGATAAAGADRADGAAGRPQARQAQTQFVRINNNPFTAERGFFGGGDNGGRAAEVIERGGTGAFHGQGAFNFQDSHLNARNAFASNRPRYQQRELVINAGGPVIKSRLSATGSISNSESQNADTVHATLPDGVFELGIVHPNTNRSGGVRGTYQLTDRHSLMFNVRRGASVQRNNSVGGFTLPERGSSTHRSNSNVDMRQFSALSDRMLFEQSLQIQREARRNRPFSESVAIDVLDAFRSGGGQDRSETSSTDYVFGNLLTKMGSVWTLKAGVNGSYRTNDDISNNNFTGTFTFSSLDDYLAGRPVTFRVTRGEPRIGIRQLELSPFVQNDLKITRQLTLMLGARYEYQTNLSDANNLAPRVGLAWALDRTLVVRAGAGLFYLRLQDNMVQTQRRLNGLNQWEVVVNDPSWPDPFQRGTQTIKPPASIRVTDPALVAPYHFVLQGSVEKTFPTTLLLSAGIDRTRGVHLFRSHNVNAPLPGQTTNPDPARGQVVRLESSASSLATTLRLAARQRFSIFNVSANYAFGEAFSHVDGWMSLPSDNYDLQADWGPSSFRARHAFNGSVNAQLPLGLFLTASQVWNSGQPYTITTGRDDNVDGVTNDRPAGTPRNSATGPDFRTTSVNISKAIFFGEQGRGGSGTNLNWFVNLSNAFNRVNRGTPSGVITSPNFGSSTSARRPRELEIGARFSF